MWGKPRVRRITIEGHTMTAKNEHTGDLIMSKGSSKEFKSNYSKIFGNKKPQRGKWVYDSVTRKLLPADEFYALKAKRERASELYIGGPTLHVFQPYVSDANNQLIDSPNKEREMMRQTGTRPWEGMDQETKVANQKKKEKIEKNKQLTRDLLRKTKIQLRDGMTPKPNIKLNKD